MTDLSLRGALATKQSHNVKIVFMKPQTENWFRVASKELRLAELALNGNEPLGVIQHLHAAIEKTLKGIYEETKGNPPKIRGLKMLALDSCGISLQEKERKLFDILDKAFISSRYPIDLDEFEKAYNIDSCERMLKEVKDTIKWLKSLLTNN